MKVHLIKTPEYDEISYWDVLEVLASPAGPLNFDARAYEFNTAQFPFLKNKRLSWEDLFGLCSFYRKTFSIPSHDFIILLTDLKNDLNFFSFYDEHRNAFVQTSGWEHIINAPQKFPVAYQVVANILRILMKMPPGLPDHWFHTYTIGCMNDLCANKKEIIIKLRTGDICNECLCKMKEARMDEEIIDHAIGLFEIIRKQLLFVQGFSRNITPKTLTVDASGMIMIGDKEIKLDYLPKTLFIFFLKHLDGVTFNDLPEFRAELLAIYKTLRPGGSERAIDNLIAHYLYEGTFSKNKNSLNKKLKAQLGEPLAGYYYLNGNRGEVFRIGIATELVHLDFHC
ncbi:MAG TPA: hypothetical protein PK269_04580 [Bacteroidales bacterium]|mgnify:CR=1 FL=1|nr:hypothetical protein [Bacteroidales bacterium]